MNLTPFAVGGDGAGSGPHAQAGERFGDQAAQGAGGGAFGDQALDALDKDREFLKVGGVMSDDFIDGYIALKMVEVTKFRAATHPLEYQLYYGL